MKFVLFPLALLIVAGIFLLKKLMAVAKDHSRESGSIRVVVIVRNQEQWVEGFIRKLFRCMRSRPRTEVLVIDDGSRDGTPEVLSRLQRVYSFELLPLETGDAGEAVGEASPWGEAAGSHHFDVRELKGKDLLSAPLFCHLSQFNAGKSKVLSK